MNPNPPDSPDLLNQHLWNPNISDLILNKTDPLLYLPSKRELEEAQTGLSNIANSSVSPFWSQNEKSTLLYSRTVNGVEIPFYERAVKTNLHNLYEMSEQEREELIEKYELQSVINSFGKDNFFKKLAEADQRLLELANLVDLKIYSETSKLKYILINNAEFIPNVIEI